MIRSKTVRFWLWAALWLVCAGWLAAPASLQAQIDLSGEWSGAIQLPAGQLEVHITFHKDTAGAWSGDIDIPAQMARDLPLVDIQWRNRRLAFKIAGVPDEPTFDGKISEDGRAIQGQVTQHGQTFPFQLKRKSSEQRRAETATLEQKLQLIAAFVDSMRRAWDVPGAALAIVKGNEVIFARGFGYRDLEAKKPVTENTLFAIGSCTKAFTALALGLLVDDGRLDWDTPVRTYLPEFELHDRFASERMTPRDLVTHRSGLPRHDFVWYGADLSRRELFERLRYLPPSKDFRTTFQYQNLMFMTAGYLVGQVTGSTWQAFVRQRLLEPLDMRNTNFSVEDLKTAPDAALAYRKVDDRVTRIPYRNIDAMGPAGSINSSVNEMAHWIIMQLNRGKFRGRQIVSANRLQETHLPQMAITRPADFPEMSESAYGLGWFVQTYRGHKRVSHGGSIDGFKAMVNLLPNDGLGMVVLANLSGTPLPTIVSLYATDLLLDLEPIDWHQRIKARTEQAKAAKQKKLQDEERKTGTRPSHALADYTGEYEHPAYGIIRIRLNGKQLQASFHGFEAPLEHWHYDVFRFMVEDFDHPKVIFFSNENGDVDRLAVKLEPLVDAIEFRRRAPEELHSLSYLRQFEGEYVLSGALVTVKLKGQRLTLTLPGQPEYILEPYKPNRFNLKGLSGYRAVFEKGKKGEITAVKFLQPNGVFRAVKKK